MILNPGQKHCRTEKQKDSRFSHLGWTQHVHRTPKEKQEQDSLGYVLERQNEQELSVNTQCLLPKPSRPCLALSHLPLKLRSTFKFSLTCTQLGSTSIPQGKSSLVFPEWRNPAHPILQHETYRHFMKRDQLKRDRGKNFARHGENYRTQFVNPNSSRSSICGISEQPLRETGQTDRQILLTFVVKLMGKPS